MKDIGHFAREYATRFKRGPHFSLVTGKRTRRKAQNIRVSQATITLEKMRRNSRVREIPMRRESGQRFPPQYPHKAAKTKAVLVRLEGSTSILVNIGVMRNFIIDTGYLDTPAQNIEQRSERHFHDTLRSNGRGTGRNGTPVRLVWINERVYNHKFFIFTVPTKAAGLLGTVFMEEAGDFIDFKGRKITFSDMGVALRAHSDRSTEGTGVTIFLPGKAGTALNPWKSWHDKRRSSSQPAPENKIWLVKVRENIAQPTWCSQIVTRKLEIGKECFLLVHSLELGWAHTQLSKWRQNLTMLSVNPPTTRTSCLRFFLKKN